jgi:hypothetical protein
MIPSVGSTTDAYESVQGIKIRKVGLSDAVYDELMWDMQSKNMTALMEDVDILIVHSNVPYIN